MGILSRLLGNRELAIFTISFSPSGDFSVHEVLRYPISELNVIEVLCHFYVKTLNVIGDSQVSKFIIQRFSSFASDLESKGFIEVDLFDALKNVGSILDLGFDLQNHLKIEAMKFVPLVSDSKAINHQVLLLQRKSGSRFIETHPAAWQGKIYIPLALFAFLHYCSQRFFLSNRTLAKASAGCISALHQQARFTKFHRASDYAWLSEYVNGYFVGFAQGRIVFQ